MPAEALAWRGKVEANLPEHGRSSWRVKNRLCALGLRQKTAETHLSKVQSRPQKARGRPSGPRVPEMPMLEAGLDS